MVEEEITSVQGRSGLCITGFRLCEGWDDWKKDIFKAFSFTSLFFYFTWQSVHLREAYTT